VSSSGVVLSQAAILRFWLPLAASWALMSAEGPVLQAAIARLSDMQTQLAAFGIVMSVEIAIESPVIMLLATSTALSSSARNYRTLRRFVFWLNVLVTAEAVLVAFTPLYDLIISRWMGIPQHIAAAARPGMRIMTFWSAAIGFRRFLQGVLIRHGETRWVGYGTFARLLTSGGGGIALAITTDLPGVWIGSIALMCGVVTEAVFVWYVGRPTVTRLLAERPALQDETFSLRDVARYHAPLAATSLLTLMAQPIIGAGLARMPLPEENLAAWPVIWGVLFVMRSAAFALPEAVIALAGASGAHQQVRRFCLRVGVWSSAAMALLALTPLLSLYLRYVAGLPARLSSLVIPCIVLSIVLPAVNSLHSWYRGLLMLARRTGVIYRGMALNLAATAALIFGGALLKTPGAATGVVAVTAALVAELLYLRPRTRFGA
jgi:progressive ankylosis protein